MSEHKDFFRKMINDALPEVMVTNYVVIAEIVSENGTDLQMILSDGITPWLASGMLEFGSDMLYGSQTEFHSISEEDDE